MWWRDYWWTVLIAILSLPVLSVLAFSWWLRRVPNLDIEKGAKCWDVFIKLVGAFTVIVTGAFLFAKYIDQQDELYRQRERGEQRTLAIRKAEVLKQIFQFDSERHQKRRALYEEVSTLAARLANNESAEKADVLRFDELYYAALIGVEEANGSVETHMIAFRSKFKDPSRAPDVSLAQLSLSLSEACVTELNRSEAALRAQGEAIANLTVE